MSARSAPTPALRFGLGLRREISLLLPIAMLVVIGVAVFNLFAFRSSLALLAEERRTEAERLARAAAGEWSGDMTPARLRTNLPQALGIALIDSNGEIESQIGEVPAAPLPAGIDQGRSGSAGLAGDLEDRVAGFARLPGSPERYLRIDLPATVLAAQRRALRVLFPVALLASTTALILVVLFGRHAFAPYDALLERARAAGAVADHPADEIASLVETFERALTALSRPPGSPEDDIAALERALAPSLESGLLLLDREGGVIALNATGSAILGQPSPGAGTPLAQAFPAAPEIAAALGPPISSGTSANRLEVSVARRGERRSLGFTLHPLRRDDGSVRGYLALFADLTDVRREEAETRIANSLSELGELAAGLAHELRNSLATLRGYLTLIERRPDEERIADYLHEIRHETDQLQRLLDDFLSFARPGSVRLEDVSLEAVLRQAIQDPALADMAVEVVRETPAARAKGDPQLLERAVRNLLHNAVQAQRAAGTTAPLVGRLSERDRQLELAIEDRGDGVAAEVRERLFHPFATGREGGVGLGLALAHRIVHLHGGTLSLEQREAGGTRAVIRLPRPYDQNATDLHTHDPAAV
jgi:signal transduction histidine kinase